MKVLASASVIGALSLTACVQQHVSEALAEHVLIEGRRYAEEVEAQSPFDTVEIGWSEAESLMEKRNRRFVAAQANYAKAIEEKPMVHQLTDEVKEAVSISFEDVLDPGELLESLRSPATNLPKQLASLGRLKDISHEVEQSAWDQAALTVDAELAMREEKVKLHRLLRMGELIDAELERVETAPPPAESADPKLKEAVKGWRGKLREERRNWLGEVRDLFDAEYHDVRFVRDRGGLPTYHQTAHPDLGEWRRWCRLRRSKELVTVLQKAHSESKPSIPGTELVKARLEEAILPSTAEAAPVRDTASLRKEVRSLIGHWREMKAAQEEAERLENEAGDPDLDQVAEVGARKKIFELRRNEIEHASVVWMMDERCWH